MSLVTKRQRTKDGWTEFDKDLLVEMASHADESTQRPNPANQNDETSFLFLNGACG